MIFIVVQEVFNVLHLVWTTAGEADRHGGVVLLGPGGQRRYPQGGSKVYTLDDGLIDPAINGGETLLGRLPRHVHLIGDVGRRRP